jgi:hypothetical protein
MDLKTVYRTHTGRRMDAKTHAYWDEAISVEQRTVDDFKKFIISSTDYSTNVIAAFKVNHLELMGTDPSARDIDDFLRANEDTLMDEQTIVAYVASLPAFRKKCEEVVRRTSKAADQDLSEEALQHFVSRLVGDRDYDVAALTNDIRVFQAQDCHVEEYSAVPAPVTEVERVLRELLDDPSKVSSDLEAALLSRGPTKTACVPEDVPRWVAEFETLYGRPMFVQEFLRFAKVVPSAESAEDWIRSRYEVYRDIFEKTVDAADTFAGKTMTEHEFVCAHIQDIDDPGFPDRFVRSLLASPEYESKMKAQIAETYLHLYDHSLDGESLAHAFDKALKIGMGLRDERMHDFILAHKHDTDLCIERIFKIYLDVYQRDPDNEEVHKWVSLYRQNGLSADTDRIVTKAIMTDLEFHDVLKKMIRLQYLELNGHDMSPSALYKTLCCCVSALPSASDMNDVDAIVREAFTGGAISH